MGTFRKIQNKEDSECNAITYFIISYIKNMKAKELYDDIVFDYLAIKTNKFKVQYEEPLFLKSIGSIEKCTLLDLACGSGCYTRKLKEMGAGKTIGVDISEEMIKEAKKQELEKSLGIEYFVEDASKFIYDHQFDLITAQYLFCYADTKENLMSLCKNVGQNTKPGGRFISVTTFMDPNCKLDFMDLGFTISPFYENEKEKILYDGMKSNITLYSGDLTSKCSFPNFLWELKTIHDFLQSCDFSEINFVPMYEDVPVALIIATKKM